MTSLYLFLTFAGVQLGLATRSTFLVSRSLSYNCKDSSIVQPMISSVALPEPLVTFP